MQNINFNSRSEIENSLWRVGLNFHNLSHNQRMQVLNSISSRSCDLLDNDILNFVGYILHSYTIQMDNIEKKILIGIVEEKFSQKGDNLCEELEIIALLVKCSPADYKAKLVELITKQNFYGDTPPSRIISYTNAVRYIFDEIGIKEQKILYESLLSLLEKTPNVFLKPTIQYTINNIKTLLMP